MRENLRGVVVRLGIFLIHRFSPFDQANRRSSLVTRATTRKASFAVAPVGLTSGRIVTPVPT